MNEQSQSVAVAQSFADRVRAFHQDLPIEERHLLEQVFALATIAASGGQDTKGHAAFDYFLILDGFQHKDGGDVLSVLGPQSAGTKGFSWGATQTGVKR